MVSENISFKRLTEEELQALKEFLKGRKTVDYNEIDDFMVKQYNENSLFENCVASVCKQHFVIQRFIGW